MLSLLNLNIQNIFKVSFGLCFLIILHVTLDYTDGIGLYLPNNNFLWIMIAMWTGLGIWQIHKKSIIVLSRFSISVFIGSIFLFLPLLFQNNFVIELIYLRFIGIIIILLFYFALLQLKISKKEPLFLIIIGSITIKTMFELLVFFKPTFLIDSGLGSFIFNTLNQKNIFSTFLVTGPLLSLIIILKKTKTPHYLNYTNILAYSCTFFCSIMLMLLQSRTALIAFPISIILILFAKKHFNKNLIIWFFLAISGFFIGDILKENTELNSRSRFQAKITKESTAFSGNARLSIYKVSLKIWKDHLILGSGYGTFLSTFRNYYAKERSSGSKVTSFGSANVLHPHNEFLFWLVEGGILPIIGFLIMIIGFIKMTLKGGRQALALIGCFFPILFHTQLEYPFYNSTIHLILFVFFIYLIDKEYGVQYHFKNNLKIIPKLLAIIIPLCSVIFLLTVLQTGYMINKYEKTGYKKLEYLERALNPYSMKKKYDNLALKSHLIIAKKAKNQNMLKSYISIVEKNLKHSPFMFLYYDLATAYQALGNMEKAWEIYKKGKYLYPDANWKD